MPLKVLVCFVSHKDKWDLPTAHTFPQLLDVGVEHTDHHRVIWKLIPSLDEPVNADVAKRTGSESKKRENDPSAAEFFQGDVSSIH